MGDLTELLGDVYGDLSYDDPDGPPLFHEPPADQRTPAVPVWASDERLDAVFSSWTPGPAADAPAAERDAMAGVGTRLPTRPEPSTPGGGDDLAITLAAVTDSPPLVVGAPQSTAVPPAADPDGDPAVERALPAVAAARWQRHDDDILPAGRRRFRLFRR